jgi:hypothetical protein
MEKEEEEAEEAPHHTVIAGVDMGIEGFEFENCRSVFNYFRKKRRL